MQFEQVFTELESCGTDQNIKVYRRHGVEGALFGVSYGNLKTIVKKVKKDHDLALALWDSGNHDARVLATMVADPEMADETLLDSWAGDLSNYPLTDAFTAYAGKSILAREKMIQWIQSEDEWICSAGWSLLAHLAMKDDALEDSFFESYLKQIKTDIHQSRNRVKHSMNNALIAVGIRNESLEKKAIAAAEKIGKVDVDHGETSCKTPDAIPYIHKTWARKR